MTWGKLRKQFREMLAPSVRKRFDFHTACYRGYTSRDDGRAWITFDGEELTNMAASWEWGAIDSDEESIFGQGRLGWAMTECLQSSIEDILQHEDKLVQALGLLDRRCGKRRLQKTDVSQEPPLTQLFYLIRCNAEGISVPVELQKQEQHFKDNLKNKHLSRKQYRPKEQERLKTERAQADQLLQSTSRDNLIQIVRSPESVDRETLRSEEGRLVYDAIQESTAPGSLTSYFHHLHKHSSLLSHGQWVKGVVALARTPEQWLREPENWKPESKNVERQFSSLARHLYAQYDVPPFMNQVWLQGTELEQEWFRHLGLGQNMRTARELPIRLTKKMAHHFMMAPDNYSIGAAFRWAQVHALGGDRRVADALCETRLIREYENDDFWLTVIQFLVDNPMLDPAQINPIIDYIWNQRYEPVQVFIDRGVAEERPPQQPNLTMQGRSVDSLLRAVEGWHQRLEKETAGLDLQWKKSEIEDFSFAEGSEENRNSCQWRIRELLSSDELISEGRQMHHCVASYARSCHSGNCSIWTMERETDAEGIQKCVTIELRHPAQEIGQARGLRNRKVTEAERTVIQRWANLNQIQILDYVW